MNNVSSPLKALGATSALHKRGRRSRWAPKTIGSQDSQEFSAVLAHLRRHASTKIIRVHGGDFQDCNIAKFGRNCAGHEIFFHLKEG